MLGRPTGNEIRLSAERGLRWRANDCASQLQLSRERNSGLPEVRFVVSWFVMVIYESRPLRTFVTIDTTKDYSKRAGTHILWSRRHTATFAALQFRAVTMIHRMDRLQAMEMSNGRL
jgi:hypothetical protein